MSSFVSTIAAFATFSTLLTRGDELLVPTSCYNLADGLYYIKPSEDGEIMPAYCSNGYTVINTALNKEAVSSYFTSFYQYYPSEGGIYSSDCEVKSCSSSWRDWWTPSTIDTKFRVAKDCMTCESSLSYPDNTAYYLTNYYFCWNKHHFAQCSEYTRDELMYSDTLTYNVEDDATSMCNICDDDLRTSNNVVGDDGNNNWLDCMSLQLDADTVTSANHDHCMVGSALVVKPTVSNNNQYCTCYQNDESSSNDNSILDTDTKTTNYFKIEYNDEKELDSLLPTVSSTFYNKIKSMVQMDNINIVIDENIRVEGADADGNVVNQHGHKIQADSDVDCESNKVYLSNRDFAEGTLRITECGEYIFTEDILLHFNKPNDEQLNDLDWSPNSYVYNNDNDLPWFPLISQQNGEWDESGYEGVLKMRGRYQAGFYAGITIESNDVTINMNGYSIGMDYLYYFQQRFFILISLGNRMFVNDQGPANFGRQLFTQVENIVIKDGTLGLTSHHGIHGNQMKNFEISNVKIEHFDIAGLACNGCHDGLIENVVIGPQNSDIPVLGKYTHARALVPRLTYLVENYGDESVVFGGKYGGKETTITELADELVEQMDLIYNHFIRGIDYENDENYIEYNKQWKKAKELFANPLGFLDGGTSYGMILNGVGTGVTSFGRRKGDKGENLSLNNVEIYGIQTQPWERMWAKVDHGRQLQGFFFDTVDWAKIIDAENGNTYKGDAYWDIVFATSKVANSDEYCLFNTLYVTEAHDWVFEDNLEFIDDLRLSCGSDVQSHDAKGTVALRVDAVENVNLENIYIHDIQNHGELGMTDMCENGNYDVIGFLSQTYPLIEPGYTGTRSIGIITTFASISNMNNVIIENLGSKYGTAIGTCIYEGSTIDSMSNFDVHNIHAGWGFELDSQMNGHMLSSTAAQMTKDEILQLDAPNYKPKACSVEVGLGEENYPITINNDNVDENTIVGSLITGYDSCSDVTTNKRLGIVSDERSQNELLAFFQSRANTIPMSKFNDNLQNAYNKPFNYVIIITGIITLAMIVAAFTVWKCFSRVYYGNVIFENNNTTEKSPLLNIAKQGYS